MAKEVTMTDVRDFFNKGTDRPVTVTEFGEFWKSCTAEQKEQYKARSGRWPNA